MKFSKNSSLPLILSPLVAFLLYLLLPYFVAQIGALLTLVILYLSLRHQKPQLILSLSSLLLSFLIFQSGFLNSSFFFLFYFLLFASAFLFSPLTSLYLALIIGITLSPTLNSPQHLISLSSLFFIAPLAYLFGQQQLNSLAQENKIINLNQERQKGEQTISQEETNVLLWLSLNFKSALSQALEKIALMRSDLSHLSPEQKKSLEEIQDSLKKLLKSGHYLQNLVDQKTDKD